MAIVGRSMELCTSESGSGVRAKSEPLFPDYFISLLPQTLAQVALSWPQHAHGAKDRGHCEALS